MESLPTGDGRRRRRILVVRNPIAGNGRGRRLWLAVLDRLAAHRCAVEIRETAGPGAAEEIARHAAGEDFQAVVIAGGDGTINEAVNGLAGTAMPMAIVPLGTANVLAAEIGLGRDAEQVARTIVSGRQTPAHLGLANARHFILMAGVGFDAHVVRNVRPQMKRRYGKGAYVVESVRALSAFAFPRYRLTVDGTPLEAASAVIANVHYYGGRFICAPDARLSEPVLHVCLFERSGPWNAARYACALMAGRLSALPDFRVIPATEVVVNGPPGDPVQGDGDILAVLPATIRVAPRTVQIIRP